MFGIKSVYIYTHKTQTKETRNKERERSHAWVIVSKYGRWFQTLRHHTRNNNFQNHVTVRLLMKNAVPQLEGV
jgi:hypothetical protein